MKFGFLLLGFFGVVAGAARAQDAAAGENLFRQCSPCHRIGEGAPHGLGPHLNGIVG